MEKPSLPWIKISIAIVGYSVWGAMAYFDASQRAEFLHFTMGAVVGTVGLALRDMPTPKD